MGKKKKRIKKVENPPRKKKLTVVLILFLSVIGGFLFLYSQYRINTVIVEGNKHYTNEEIISYVITSSRDYNSLILYLKYGNREVFGLPFVEKMDVSIVSRDMVKITVYEKAFAGYVEYLGKYMYFDKDGIVVETSGKKTQTVPEITGLNFDHIVLHEALPVEDESIFQSILYITQLLDKYEIRADKIYFDKGKEMTLYFEDIRVRLGDMGNIDDKVVRLKAVLPELEGEKGLLRMENYEENSKNITFNRDSG